MDSSQGTLPDDNLWARVKRIFDEALQLPSQEREAYIKQACAGDPALADAVKQLLQYHVEAGSSFLTQPAPELNRPIFTPGEVLLSRLRIEAFLGSGGMGQVFRAVDLESKVAVAVKAIRPEIAANADIERRFRRELVLSRQVAHPNVCKVFEIWSTKRPAGPDIVFLTMELLEGETLAQRLQARNRLPASEALPIAKQVAAGLDEIHRHKIIHRDVKPSNVFLVSEPGGERAVVTDFGLARSSFVGQDYEVTRSGVYLGTPAYMAPELLNGHDATCQSDIYAFGITLYEMLTGMKKAVVQPRKLVRSLRRGWDEAIVRCLEPDPKRRPLSAHEAVQLIERRYFLEHLRIAALIAAILIPVALLATWFTSRKPVNPVAVTQLTFDNLVQDLSSSADGQKIVYSSDQDSPEGNLNLWALDRETKNTQRLLKSRWNDWEPALSPDGGLLAFRSEREPAGIYTMPFKGGEPPRLLARWGHHPRFSSDGKWIAYWTGQSGDFSEASARAWAVPVRRGGGAKQLGKGFPDARCPAWAPEGHKVMFFGAQSSSTPVTKYQDLYVEDLDTDKTTKTGAADFLLRYDRHLSLYPSPLFWDRDRVVFAARFSSSTNLWQLSLSSRNPNHVSDLRQLTTSGNTDVLPWVLPDGKIAYASWHGAVHIWRASTQSGVRPPESVNMTPDEITSHPTVSRDGTHLLFGRRDADVRGIFFKDVTVSGSPRIITRENRGSPTISPDGARAAFNDGPKIFVEDLATARSVGICEACGEVLSWLPGGGAILYLRAGAKQREVRLLEIDTRADRLVLRGAEYDQAVVSPEGKRIAFTVRSEGIRSVISIAPFWQGSETPLSAAIPVTSPEHWSDKPQWSSNGREIFFSSNRDGFMCLWRQAVDSATGKPTAAPQSLAHLHRATTSPMHMSNKPSFNLAAGGSWVYFNSASVTGNLWLLEP